jgi:phosphoribosylaminoimidazole-succinocarboxamide synthase
LEAVKWIEVFESGGYMNNITIKTDLDGLKLIRRGKVRDVYDLGNKLLIVASDRISAFDVIMDDPIPEKGKILNQISIFWFSKLEGIIPHHFISGDPSGYPVSCKRHAELLRGRSMLVKKATPLPVECIVRGYLSGSGWEEYKNSGKICGISLPRGLKESDRLPEPIFTPSTKAPDGTHDENITFERACEILGGDVARRVRDMSLKIYKLGSELALRSGIIVADTKFEFGFCDESLILIDEVMTPDSSRFWPVDEYRPGAAQKSFDKQYLRDYLLSIKWPKEPPPPPLPPEVVKKTREKYIEALSRLTGKGLDLF